MPEKVGFLTISATPQKPSSTKELWENADFIKNTLIPKLLTIHQHLVITVADGTLQAHNFEAFYPLQEYSELSREAAINKANAVGQTIYDDLTNTVKQHTLWQSRITILRWDAVDIEQEKLLVNKKLDSANIEYDAYLVKSIKAAVDERVVFLKEKNTLDIAAQEKIKAQSTQYFVDEVAHAYKILEGIELPINNESVVCQPEIVWYPGLVPNLHPIPYVFRIGDINIFHRISQQVDVDAVIKKVGKKLKSTREAEKRVECITVIKEAHELQACLSMLASQIMEAQIMQKDEEDEGSRESRILTYNAHYFLTEAKKYLMDLVRKPDATADVSLNSPSNTVITSAQGTAATANSSNVVSKSPLFQNLSTTSRKLSNSSSDVI
ncbi:MAG: hypothetical protein WC748_02710 [Legionellales bacterium]|jgi:hypothetical protein